MALFTNLALRHYFYLKARQTLRSLMGNQSGFEQGRRDGATARWDASVRCIWKKKGREASISNVRSRVTYTSINISTYIRACCRDGRWRRWAPCCWRQWPRKRQMSTDRLREMRWRWQTSNWCCSPLHPGLFPSSRCSSSHRRKTTSCPAMCRLYF